MENHKHDSDCELIVSRGQGGNETKVCTEMRKISISGPQPSAQALKGCPHLYLKTLNVTVPQGATAGVFCSLVQVCINNLEVPT